MFQQTDIENLNADIEQWATAEKQKMVSRLDALGVKHSKNSPDDKALQKSVSGKTSKQFDMVNRISFGFNKSGIWLAKGVSRGHPVTNPRAKKDWFVTDEELDQLTEIVAEGDCNLIVNALAIKIK